MRSAPSASISRDAAALLAALGQWVDAVREHDLAALGYVHYAALPPPQLAPAEQKGVWDTPSAHAHGTRPQHVPV